MAKNDEKVTENGISVLEKYIILLLGVDDTPVDLLHMRAMLFMLAKVDPELQAYIDEHGGIRI